MARMEAKEKWSTETWAQRHQSAITLPNSIERPLRDMLRGWEAYAKTHKQQFETPIGSDYVLGRYWQDMGEALRGLLNGNCGRFDCGTLDAFILDTMQENGIDTSTL